MIYGVVDTLKCSIDLCQAGHPHLLYLKPDHAGEFIANSNLPVGILPDTHYESVTIDYRAGDRIFVYSDGITECESPEGEMFGSERLRRFVEATSEFEIGVVMQKLNAYITEWHGDTSFEDDISVLMLEFGPNNCGCEPVSNCC